MDDGDTFGWLAIFQGYFTAGGTAGIDQAFEFHGGEHIIQGAIVEFRDAGWVKILEAGSQYDGAYGQIKGAIFHVMIDSPSVAG